MGKVILNTDGTPRSPEQAVSQQYEDPDVVHFQVGDVPTITDRQLFIRRRNWARRRWWQMKRKIPFALNDIASLHKKLFSKKEAQLAVEINIKIEELEDLLAANTEVEDAYVQFLTLPADARRQRTSSRKRFNKLNPKAFDKTGKRIPDPNEGLPW